MAQGTDVIIAAAKGTAWNTAVAVNATNNGVALNSWPLGVGLGDPVYSNALVGGGFRASAIRGLNKLNGDAPADLRYTGFEHQVAMAMGTAGNPTVVDTSARQHIFDLATNLDTLFDTIAVFIGAGIAIREYPSVKYGGFVLDLTADGLATITFPIIASDAILDSVVNTTLAAVTYRTKVLNVFGTHIKFRANVASGAGLLDSDRFYPSRVVLTYRRNIDSAFVMDGSGVQPEPYYTDFPTVTLDLEFPVFGTGTLQTNDTFLTNALAETPMKFDITMTSPVMAGDTTTPYSILIQAPNVVVANDDNPITGGGVIPKNVSMVMLEAATAPTGMSGVTRPFRWTQVSKLITNAITGA